MTATLNQHLLAQDALTTKPCAEMTRDELVALQRFLHSVRDPAFEEIYRTTDDNRRLSTFGNFTSELAELEALWAEEAEIIERIPSLHDMSRDGKCHEAVMWFTHHLSEGSKAEAKEHKAVRLDGDGCVELVQGRRDNERALPEDPGVDVRGAHARGGDEGRGVDHSDHLRE